MTGVDFMAITKGFKSWYKNLFNPHIIPNIIPAIHEITKPTTTLIKVMAILYQNFDVIDNANKAFRVFKGEGR